MLKTLADIMKLSGNPVNIFVSTRPPHQSQKDSNLASIITISPESNRGDVDKYLQKTLYTR